MDKNRNVVEILLLAIDPPKVLHIDYLFYVDRNFVIPNVVKCYDFYNVIITYYFCWH